MGSLVRIILVLSLAARIIANEVQNRRAKYNFNSGWKVLIGDLPNAKSVDFDDTLWKKVTVPYAWNEGWLPHLFSNL
jgi:beta-galactosidase